MVFIIQEPKKRENFSQRLGDVLGNAIGSFPEQFADKIRQKREDRAIQERFGEDLKGLSSSTRQEFIKSLIKGETGNQQKEASAQSALSAVDALEALVGQAGIGMSGQLNPSNKAKFNRGEFDSTTAALLPAFKALFPRGFTEKEFNRIVSDYIPSSGDTEERILGKLSGLRKMIGDLSGGRSNSQLISSGKKKILGDEQFSGAPVISGSDKNGLKEKLSALLHGVYEGGRDIAGLNPLMHSALPSSIQERVLEEVLPVEEDDKYLQRLGRVITSAAIGPEAIPLKAAQALFGTLGGEVAEGMGIGEFGQSLAEVGGMGIPGLAKGALSAKFIPKASQKEAYNLLKEAGIKDKDIIPFIQSDRKINILSQVAKKTLPAKKIKSQLSSVAQPLYASLEKKAEGLPPLSGKKAVDFAHDFENSLRKLPRFRQEEIQKETNRLLSGSFDYKSLRDFEEYLNHKIGPTEGGKAVIGLLKNPIHKGMYEISPQLAKETRMVNEIYSKGMNFVDQLTPGDWEKLVDMGSAGSAILGIITLNPTALAPLGIRYGSSVVARSLLTNPRLQNLRKKMISSIKNGNKGALLRLYDAATKEIEKFSRVDQIDRGDQSILSTMTEES